VATFSGDSRRSLRVIRDGLKSEAGIKQMGIKQIRLTRTLAHAVEKEALMLRWALTFFIVAIVAALLGFTGIAVATAGIAKILFYVFLVLFLISLVGHLLRRT